MKYNLPEPAQRLAADIEENVAVIAQRTPGGIAKCDFEVRQAASTYLPDAVRTYRVRVDAEGAGDHQAALDKLLDTLGTIDAGVRQERARLAESAKWDQEAYGRFVDMRFPFPAVKPHEVPPAPQTANQNNEQTPEKGGEDTVAQTAPKLWRRLRTGLMIGTLGPGLLSVLLIPWFVSHGNSDDYRLTASDVAFVKYCGEGRGVMQRVKHRIVRNGTTDRVETNFYPTCVGGEHAGFVEADGKQTSRPDPKDAAAHLPAQHRCIQAGGTYHVKMIAAQKTEGGDPDMKQVGIPACVGGRLDGRTDPELVIEQIDIDSRGQDATSLSMGGKLPQQVFGP